MSPEMRQIINTSIDLILAAGVAVLFVEVKALLDRIDRLEDRLEDYRRDQRR